MRHLLSVVALACVAAACSTASSSTRTSSSAPQPNNVNYGTIAIQSGVTLDTKSTIVEGSIPQTWIALALAYQDIGIPLAAHDSTQYYLGNPGLRVRRQLGNVRLSRYLNCGNNGFGLPLADSYDVLLSVVSRVGTRAGSTVVETQVMADANQPGVSAPPVKCSSAGVLEETIANAVKLRLSGIRTP